MFLCTKLVDVMNIYDVYEQAKWSVQ